MDLSVEGLGLERVGVMLWVWGSRNHSCQGFPGINKCSAPKP